jgi:ribose 5-phosphate isomerase B
MQPLIAGNWKMHGMSARVRRVGIAADHGGFDLKTELSESLRGAGCEFVDFGAYRYDAADDYPDFVTPLAQAVATAQIERALALCGSGVGGKINVLETGILEP